MPVLVLTILASVADNVSPVGLLHHSGISNWVLVIDNLLRFSLRMFLSSLPGTF